MHFFIFAKGLKLITHENLDALWPNGLGDALARKGDYEAAAGEYAAVLKVRPNQASAYVQLGLIRGAQARLDEATKAFSEALRLQPDNAPAQQHLAAIRRRQGKTNDPQTPGPR